MTAEFASVDRTLAARVLAIVDAGLVSGLGIAEPGKMCVEAAVCYAMDLPHGDAPPCVSPTLRRLKIGLNDAQWVSKMSRARGLRRLAIAQLGSAGALDETKFVKRVAKLAIQTVVPTALRAAASLQKDSSHRQALLDAANRCEIEGTRASARAAAAAAESAACAYAESAANAAYAAKSTETVGYAVAYATAAVKAAYTDAIRDKTLSDFAEGVVQILIDMDAPGAAFLDLAPFEAAA